MLRSITFEPYIYMVIYVEVTIVAILGIYRLFPFMSDPTQLHLDKILPFLYIGKRVKFDTSSKLT